MRFGWVHRLPRGATYPPVLLTGVLIAGLLTKMGYSWWAIAVLAGLSVLGTVVEGWRRVDGQVASGS